MEPGQSEHTACAEWKAGAAYLYVLRLVPAQLAWEYLRRHAGYRTAACREGESPHIWGLESFEDPHLDARMADPRWLEPDTCVALTRVADPSADCFDLWRFAGPKRLDLRGAGFELSLPHLQRTRRVSLADTLNSGDPFGYVLPSSTRFEQIHLAVREIASGYSRDSMPRVGAVVTQRPARSAVLHMRAVQTLDALGSGASHLQIAEVLFGCAYVKDRWSAESELRAQVRYLIKRAKSLRDGGHRELLDVAPPKGRRKLQVDRFSVSASAGLA